MSGAVSGERRFQGRALLPGEVSGPCLVSRAGVNLLATYRESALKRAKQAIGSDANNPELYGRDLTGKIICLPKTIGSTSGGLALMTVADLGIAPAALLFSEPIDSLAAAGIILSDIWLGRHIVTVDSLGAEFLEALKDGTILHVNADGEVWFEVPS